MAYVAPARMAALTNVTTQDWISSHLQPNDNQMDHLFHHVYPDLNQVLNVCRLTSWQKYAVLRQGVTSIADVCMLGATMETIHDNFKHFNSLTKARGGTNFGAIHYTHDRILSTTPGAEPPRDARDSGSARSHSTHLETSSSDRP